MFERTDKSDWESPKFQCLSTKLHTNSGVTPLPIEILGIKVPLTSCCDRP